MREFKFRAWDCRLSNMVYSDDCFFAFLNGKLLERDGKAFDCYDHSSDIIMQYTGLKDKNGKEIYEGDIIESSKTGIHFAIKWFNANCQYGGTNGMIWFDPERFNDSLIIGNIYENPELLK